MHSVKLKKLTKRFGKLVAVDNISFSIETGEIFGLLGPNGAGKTTTLRMLTTLLTPDSGTAKVNYFDILEEPMKVRENIGVIEQDVSLEGRLSAFENLKFHARIYHKDSKEMDNRIYELIELIGLGGREHDLVNTYSGGMKRRLEIIKSILHEPKLVFMDEPTVGLDTQTRMKIWEYIKEMCKNDGITVFLTTHYIDEADFLCDRVAIIDQGKLIALDTPGNLKKLIGGDFVIDILVDEKDMSKLEGLIKKLGIASKKRGNSLRIVSKSRELLPKVMATAGTHKIEIKNVSLKEPSLEDVFIHLTGKAIRETRVKKKKEIIRGR